LQRDDRSVHDAGSISELAYRLWESRGRPEGSPERDWLEAERQLASAADLSASAAVDEALQETFPASDPAASQLPDEPPSNAEAKWTAAGAPRAKSGPRAAGTRRKSSPPAGPKDNGRSPDR